MTGRHLVLFTLLTLATCLPAAWSPADEPTKAEKPVADSMLGEEAGEVRDDNGLTMKMVWCPPRFFHMEQGDGGQPRSRRIEKTVTPLRVFLSRGYWLGKYEVTEAEWKQVMATEPWTLDPRVKEGNDFPATVVGWKDAMEFCRRLTARERIAKRLPDDWEYMLPTEAQWERACRARTETEYSFGDDPSLIGGHEWFQGNAWNAGEAYPHRVGQKKPNPWGLHDMHGNVSEWCRDWYGRNHPGGRDPEVTASDVLGTKDPSQAVASRSDAKSWPTWVVRGGGFVQDALNCRSARRAPEISGNMFVGFRVALSPVQPAK